MWRRTLLPLLAVLGLMASSLHAPAMAVTMLPMPVRSAPVSAIPAEPACHQAASAQTAQTPGSALVKTASKTPQKGECCGTGCGDACSPVAAFFASAPQRLLGFLRSVVEAEAVARAPTPRPDPRERPPRAEG